MAKKKKRPKTLIFTLRVGAYPDETVVAVGATKSQVLAYAKRNDFRKDWIAAANSEEGEIFNLQKGTVGRFVFDKEARLMVVVLRPFEDSWGYWETLIHELHHLVHHVAERRSFSGEHEAQAYLQEFLFRRIRRRLTGIER